MRIRFKVEGYDGYIKSGGVNTVALIVETVPEIILGKALVQMRNKKFGCFSPV